MAFDSRDLTVKIKGDTSDFEKSMGKVKGESDNAGLSFGKLTGAVALGNLVAQGAERAFSFLSGQIRSTIESASESQKAITQLETVLKSTGGAAGVTSKQLQDQASALQRMTTFSDEAVMSAQSLLLTFTNVKGQVFKDSVPLILDMSQALGQDLKSSSIQLGKALNDPIKGITALSRVGVSFTTQQKEMIKSLVDTGQTAKAQQVILKELRTEFGGSAEAAGTTFAGSLARLKNQLDDVKEKLGGAIIQGITPFTTALAGFVSSDKFQAWADKTSAFIVKLNTKFFEFLKAVYPLLKEAWKQIAATMHDWIIPAFEAVRDVTQQFIDKYPQLSALIGIMAAIGVAFMINPIVTVIAAIVVGLVLLHQHWQQVVDVFNSGMKIIGTALAPFMPIIKFIGNTIMEDLIKPLLNLGITLFTVVLPALKNLWDALAPVLIPVLEVLAIILGGVLLLAFKVIAAAIHVVIDIIRTLAAIFGIAVDAISVLVDILTGNFKAIPNALKGILTGVVDIITAPFRDAFKIVKGGVDDVVKKLKDLSPFTKHSPSLVELVTGGTTEITKQYGDMYRDLNKMARDVAAPDMVSPIATSAGITTAAPAPVAPINITVAPEIGMYAGMPQERRSIAVQLWQDLQKEARAQGVQLPNINVAGVQ